MPYKSDRQRRWAHTASARKAGFTASMTKEYDSASRGMKLPEKKFHRLAKARRGRS